MPISPGKTSVVFGTGNTAKLVDGGNIVAATGSAVLDVLEFDTDNSSSNNSSFGNNTGGDYTVGRISGKIGAGDFTIDTDTTDTSKTIIMGGNIDLTSTLGSTGSFKVEGEKAIDAAGKNINLGGNGQYVFDYTGMDGTGAKTGVTDVKQFVTNAGGTTIVDFVTSGGDKSYQVAETMVNGGDTFHTGNFTIGAAPTDGAASGFYATGEAPGAAPLDDKGQGALTIGAEMTVNGNFTVADDYTGSTAPGGKAAIIIDGSKFDNGDTAITVTGTGDKIDITAGTVFQVDNAELNSKIQVIDGANAADEWGNLTVAGGSNTFVDDGSGDYNYYKSDDGYFVKFDGASVNNARNGQPRYARGFVNAQLARDGYSGIMMANSTNEEKVMAMGNNPDATLMIINNPIESIFRNNNNMHPQTQNRLAKSAGDCENYGLWITPNASFRSIDGNYGQGYGDIDIKSYGVTVGFDGWVHENFRLGLFAGVNSTELDGDFQDIDGDDFQLGVYGQAVLPEGFMLNLGLAYSWQNYDASRKVFNTKDTNFNQRIKSDFDGNTIIAAIELNKYFSLDYDMFLRPSIGYTYLGTTLDSYKEKSSRAAHDYYNLAQRVGETDFDQHIFRVGTDIGWSVDNAAVIGRLYYVGNAGDDQPESKARFRYANAGVPSFKIYGSEYDDSMANLGLTVKVAPSENSHFAVDYDALLGSNSTTHNVNLTFKYEW